MIATNKLYPKNEKKAEKKYLKDLGDDKYSILQTQRESTTIEHRKMVMFCRRTNTGPALNSAPQLRVSLPPKVIPTHCSGIPWFEVCVHCTTPSLWPFHGWNWYKRSYPTSTCCSQGSWQSKSWICSLNHYVMVTSHFSTYIYNVFLHLQYAFTSLSCWFTDHVCILGTLKISIKKSIKLCWLIRFFLHLLHPKNALQELFYFCFVVCLLSSS